MHLNAFLLPFQCILFQRFPPLELGSLQDYILRNTLFSSTLLRRMNLAMYIGLIKKKTVSVAREVCFGLLRRRIFVQMAASAYADAHAQGGISPWINLRQLTPIKTAVLTFLQDVLQYHYLVLQNVKLVLTY